MTQPAMALRRTKARQEELARPKVPHPTGPPGNWLTGNLRDLRRDMLGFYTQMARDYGDVVSFRVGPRRLYLLAHPEYIEDVLVTRNRLFGRPYVLGFLKPVLGNGLLLSDGPFWLRQRRLAQPAFQKNRIAAYAPAMVEYTQRLADQYSSGQTRDLHADMMQLTLQIVAKTLFDADVARDAPDVGDALEAVMHNFLSRFQSAYPIPPIIPTPGNLRLRRAVRRLDEVIYRIIGQRRTRSEDRGDLLSLLLRATDESDGGGMTDRQLRDEVMTLFLAGHETTAIALSWTWYLLAQNPAAEQKLHAELDAVLKGNPPTLEDLPQLKYAEMVVQESMRLYPPAYTISRKVLEDCVIGGYQLRRGSSVMLSQWVVHRDGRWYERPELFEPQRWANGPTQRMPKFAYFPFGGGPRLCIGNSFAMMEAVLVLATLAQRFRFRLVPGHTVTPWPSITLRPKDGILASVERR